MSTDGFLSGELESVRSCTVCAAAAKSSESKQLRMGTEFFSAVPWQPFTTNWAMDLIGPLTPTKKGHKCIVTWVDRTSKMIFAAAAADGHMTQ